MTEWTEEDKIQWTLEKGSVDWSWIYESSNSIVYKRPIGEYPPWIAEDRIKIGYLTKTGNFEPLETNEGEHND